VLGRPSRPKDRMQRTKLEIPFGHAFDRREVSSSKSAVRAGVPSVRDQPSRSAPWFESEVAMRTSVPGVATGLAGTPVGGDILFIEATRTPGKGALILTGQLADVMRESAQAALTLVKTRSSELGGGLGVLEGSGGSTRPKSGMERRSR
jgi:ATP-dependent Lon protease